MLWCFDSGCCRHRTKCILLWVCACCTVSFLRVCAAVPLIDTVEWRAERAPLINGFYTCTLRVALSGVSLPALEEMIRRIIFPGFIKAQVSCKQCWPIAIRPHDVFFVWDFFCCIFRGLLKNYLKWNKIKLSWVINVLFPTRPCSWWRLKFQTQSCLSFLVDLVRT